MPIQRLEGGKWWCAYPQCNFHDDNRETVFKHEVDSHLIPQREEWDRLLKDTKHRAEPIGRGSGGTSVKCKNCGHLIVEREGKVGHKQSNHSMFCPCRKPDP